jgi:hypothetical protein
MPDSIVMARSHDRFRTVSDRAIRGQPVFPH